MDQVEDNSLTFNGPPLALPGEKAMIQNISLNKIKLGRNSRMKMKEGDDDIAGLMQSIKEVGLLQPIGVVPKNGGFEICYGNRRFMAVSKLGLNKIPAIVHNNKKEADIDLKNLTENIQRRNISPMESGRYIEILKAQGLSEAEIGVRLGVSANYIQSCVVAFNDVPEEFKADIETVFGKSNKKGAATTPGKISPSVARKIVNVKKEYSLNRAQTHKLFKAAKGDSRFKLENISKYAAALDRGSVAPLDDVDEIHPITVRFSLSVKNYEKLLREHITDGPFSSMQALIVAVLRGEKSVRIPILK